MHLSRFTILALPLLTAGSLVASAAVFSDTTSSPYASAIAALEERSIIEGYSDGTFRPLATINRAEFLKILMEARYPDRSPKDLRCFTDLDVQIPQWYARTTCAAAELGIVQGYADGTFHPERTVQLDEALKMAFLTYDIRPSDTGGQWYERYLAEARSRGILIGLLSQPAHKLTRGEMAQLTYAIVIDHESSTGVTETNPICGNGVQESSEQCDDGNTEDSDGCSSICIIVPEPVRRAFLQIDQQTTGILTTIARGQKNVTLLKFHAVAGRQDAVLTSLVFQPSVGSLLYAQNYALMMDRNGDGIFETTAQASGKVEAGRLIFDAMIGGGIDLPVGLTVPFLVKADLVSGSGPVTLGLEFMSSLPDYVEAHGSTDGLALDGIQTDGTCTASTCFITVNTSGSTDITAADQGNLFVTQDSVPLRSHILLGSTTTDGLLRLRLRAEGEAIDITNIRIDGVVASVDALLLYRLRVGESLNTSTMTPFAQASTGQCVQQPATRFCANLPLRTLVIEPDHETVIVVVARMKSDHMGSISGQTMTLTLAHSTDTDGRALEAYGIASTRTLAQNDGNGIAGGEIFIGVASPAPNSQIVGTTNDTSLAGIQSIVNDATSTESFIPTGFNRIAAFKIAAVPHTNSQFGYDDVILRTLTFRVTAQNVQIDPLSFTLSTKTNPEAHLTCSAAASTGVFDVVCSGIQNGSLQSRIGQGEYVTYTLSAQVTNGQIAQGTSLLYVALPLLGTRTQTNSIEWSDQTTVFSWVDIPETSVSSTVYRN